jgi:hypothetical protein
MWWKSGACVLVSGSHNPGVLANRTGQSRSVKYQATLDRADRTQRLKEANRQQVLNRLLEL